METRYFGSTETHNDPSLDFSWVDNLYDGNLIITKRLNNKLIDLLCREDIKSKVILHLTCTGMGGSKLEPFVPTPEQNRIKFSELIDKGFPINQVVLRIDPIIPTEKALNTTVKTVLELFSDTKIPRVRFSIIDMYKHVIKQFNDLNLPLPFNGFNAPLKLKEMVVNYLVNYKKIHNLDWNLECCAEIDIKHPEIVQCGCVSQKDIEILGIEDKIELIGIGDGKQRKSCSCPSNKKQLMKNTDCSHKCLYCYWK